jgi:Uma2 family endonuclease
MMCGVPALAGTPFRYPFSMTTRPEARLTPDEYLRVERAAEWKSEYIDGEMFAMSGASWRHNVIVTNIVRVLANQLFGGPCTVVSQDQRVATDGRRHYTYPDVVVVCDPPQFVDDQFDTVTNPSLIVEVLSDSTENYNRGAKFERYRAVPSLSEYMLVSQERIHVELYTRQAGGEWVLREWSDPAAEIEIVSLRGQIKIAEVYAAVTFDEPTA